VVYGVDLGFRFVLRVLVPVALEAEVSLVFHVEIRQVDVHHTAAPFDAAYDVALAVAEAADRARGILQRAFLDSHRVELLIHTSLKVPNVDELLRVTSDQQGELAAHLMDGLE